ncbi:GH3 domain-containing protein isoform X2 [Rhinoraja longicauda]
MLLIAVFVPLALWILLLLWRDVCTKSWGQKRSLFSLLHQYMFQRYVSLLSLRQRRSLERSTGNVQRLQDRTLLHRIHRDRSTEYGKLYRFSEVSDRLSFCSVHPLTQYGHYTDYIQRIGKGEENILISGRPSVLTVSSGTSGAPAVLLCVQAAMNDLHQHQWEQLVEDIRFGRVNPSLTVADDLRLRLNAQLKPDPRRASELAVEFASGFCGIARRVWPHLNLVLVVDSGANELYGSNLQRVYCEGVPTYSPVYAAAEGLIGVNLWPERRERHYLLCPQSMFYEFIPVNLCEEEQPRTLFLEEVKENELYELVVTNASGLYRYRMGDAVKVVAFHNQCPVIEFQYRQSQTLNVRGERITEAAFYQTLLHAVKLWPGAVLHDYCCVESGLLGSCGGSDPHYEVFVEIEGVRNLSEAQRYRLDQCLQEDSTVYQSFRRKGSIGPVRVHIVALGSFKELTDFIVAHLGISHNQFQMPRVLKKKEFLDFIQRKVIS